MQTNLLLGYNIAFIMSLQFVLVKSQSVDVCN